MVRSEEDVAVGHGAGIGGRGGGVRDPEKPPLGLNATCTAPELTTLAPLIGRMTMMKTKKCPSEDRQEVPN